MKKVGIIDNFISNWHSNTYFKLFHEIAEEENREEYVITHIYAKTNENPTSHETTEKWCEKTGAKSCSTIEEVCDAVDVIMILAPNNPEMHEELCEIPFKSGKPVYVDKTFAPDFESAKRIIEYGKKCGANYWSSSATRFEPALAPFLSENAPKVSSLSISSGNVFEIYCIHLIELMNTFMKEGAKSVICHSNTSNIVFEVIYNDGRKAFLNQFVGTYADFACYPEVNGSCKQYFCKGDFWKGFSRALLNFFDTSIAPISLESTLECIAVRDALIKAIANPKTEITVEV